MTPAQQFIARMKLAEAAGTPVKRLPPNVANPQSPPCLIDLRALERARDEALKGLERKPHPRPRIW